MKRFLIVIFLLILVSPAAFGEEFAAPSVPSEAEALMPEDNISFGEGLLSMLQKLLPSFREELRQGIKTGLSVFCCVLLISILQAAGCAASASELAGGVCVTCLMLGSSRSLISLAAATVTELSEYSKLFLPVLAAAASARGSITSSAALCTGTLVFSSFLGSVVRRLLLGSVYLYLACAAANCAIGEDMLKKAGEQLKKLSAWFLKTLLAVFLTYMSITGAVTGTADKTALKATKAAISTVVPVIGKTLSDASEALLLSAELVKNSLGIYGIFAFFAIFLAPFVKIGVQYLVMKLVSMLCSVVGSKRLAQLTEDFSSAMGILLGMIGAMCALSIIGTVSFLKGAA